MNKDLLKYHSDYKQFRKNKHTIQVLEWIPKNHKVLEFGCHTGLLSKALKEEKNSSVTGVDINKDALVIAKSWQDKSYLIDIEDYKEWEGELRNSKFDIILFLHILEHLRNPEEVLHAAIKKLKADGFIIIGLPNISNINERFNMLKGLFEYEETGVMDKTHYKMFNYHSAVRMIKDNNLKIVDYKSPQKYNPLKFLLSKTFLFKKISLFLPAESFFTKNNPNLTDPILLFKCVKI